MAEMTREECLAVFEKYDGAALSFHNVNPQAFSDMTVGYAKVLLKLNEKKDS